MWESHKFTEHDKAMLLYHSRRISDLEAFQISCDARHIDSINEGRRLSDKIDASLQCQRNTEDTVKSILQILTENIPTVQRSRNNFIAIDTVKSWALWFAALASGIAAVAAILHVFTATFTG